MNPISHLLTGWVVANTADLTVRDRALVTLAGVVPDIDGLGVVAEILTEHTTSPLLWYSKYHHVLGHNLGFGMLLTAAVILRWWFSISICSVILSALAARMITSGRFPIYLLFQIDGNSYGPASGG